MAPNPYPLPFPKQSKWGVKTTKRKGQEKGHDERDFELSMSDGSKPYSSGDGLCKLNHRRDQSQGLFSTQAKLESKVQK